MIEEPGELPRWNLAIYATFGSKKHIAVGKGWFPDGNRGDVELSPAVIRLMQMLGRDLEGLAMESNRILPKTDEIEETHLSELRLCPKRGEVKSTIELFNKDAHLCHRFAKAQSPSSDSIPYSTHALGELSVKKLARRYVRNSVHLVQPGQEIIQPLFKELTSSRDASVVLPVGAFFMVGHWQCLPFNWGSFGLPRVQGRTRIRFPSHSEQQSRRGKVILIYADGNKHQVDVDFSRIFSQLGSE